MTLIEMMIAMLLGSILVAFGVALTGGHARLVGVASDRLDMYQRSRLAMNVIAQDVRHAGVGIGYRPSGWFPGLSRGSFTTIGGGRFESDGRAIELSSGLEATDDLGIRLANGDFRTIASFDRTTAQMCSGGDFDDGDVVVFSSPEGLHSQTVAISGLAAEACTEGQCRSGCTGFTWVPIDAFRSSPLAVNASYATGQVASGYEHVVWYVRASEGRGQLRRAGVTPDAPCSGPAEACGGTVAENVETLQVRVWQWDRALSRWTDVTGESELMSRDRLRVDLEMVFRSDQDFGEAPQPEVRLELENRCVPECDGVRDHVARWAVRTSVEIRNSGRMEIR
jgi:prepilin-type N-terminal cleavage/methylation domain-containing protein